MFRVRCNLSFSSVLTASRRPLDAAEALLSGRRRAMTAPIRNRIKSHRRVRAGDLVPHELNFRLHPERQARALRALYRAVGFARSLLAYELPDGRLKLIDGHLR